MYFYFKDTSRVQVIFFLCWPPHAYINFHSRNCIFILKQNNLGLVNWKIRLAFNIYFICNNNTTTYIAYGRDHQIHIHKYKCAFTILSINYWFNVDTLRYWRIEFTIKSDRKQIIVKLAFLQSSPFIVKTFELDQWSMFSIPLISFNVHSVSIHDKSIPKQNPRMVKKKKKF